MTALYTSQVWIQGRLKEAELFDHPRARLFFHGVTWIYRLARWLRPGMAELLPTLIHRHLMIDHLLRESGATQVLELAAGLSSRGARFSADSDVVYTEVDLDRVIGEKQRLLGRTARGREVAARENLRFITADVTQRFANGILDPGRPAFVIAEGLHMYLDVTAQQRLWSEIAGALQPGGGTFVFDHFQRAPSRRPGRVAGAVLEAMTRLQGRVGFVPDHRGPEEVGEDLRRAGFHRVERLVSRDVARAWSLPLADRDTDVVLYLARKNRSQDHG